MLVLRAFARVRACAALVRGCEDFGLDEPSECRVAPFGDVGSAHDLLGGAMSPATGPAPAFRCAGAGVDDDVGWFADVAEECAVGELFSEGEAGGFATVEDGTAGDGDGDGVQHKGGDEVGVAGGDGGVGGGADGADGVLVLRHGYSRNWDIQIFANLPRQKLLDFAMARHG